MPKEVIHDDTPYRVVGESEVSEQSTPYAVEVSWGRDTHVQIASINLTVDKDNPNNPFTSGWFVDLDRAMVNRLIRVLRRARDQAYGADE